MKALWLSTLTAACLLFGTVAHAGDRGHGRHDGWNDRHYSHGRVCDDRRDYGRHRGWDDHRHVGYREVYYRPVYYRPAPVYYERARGYRHYDDGEIHGSIRIGF